MIERDFGWGKYPVAKVAGAVVAANDGLTIDCFDGRGREHSCPAPLLRICDFLRILFAPTAYVREGILPASLVFLPPVFRGQVAPSLSVVFTPLLFLFYVATAIRRKKVFPIGSTPLLQSGLHLVGVALGRVPDGGAVLLRIGNVASVLRCSFTLVARCPALPALQPEVSQRTRHAALRAAFHFDPGCRVYVRLGPRWPRRLGGTLSVLSCIEAVAAQVRPVINATLAAQRELRQWLARAALLAGSVWTRFQSSLCKWSVSASYCTTPEAGGQSWLQPQRN